ncbi:uncharacterized protein LOC131444844 [Solea solea]|uniref:uncharacterized protein LOC131444844 n=1 Tax=Solea solea TaxID=90069 RepID=UPI002729B805|nr:uncharacterized protein LOC131444844 [Solea solea]
MIKGRTLVLLTLLCVLYCVLRPSLAKKLNCTFNKIPEGYRYSVHLNQSGCIATWSTLKDTVWTVVANNAGHGPGVVRSNVTTVVTDRCVSKMVYEVDCEDWTHDTGVCEPNCSAIKEKIEGDKRGEGEDVLQVTVSEMRSLLEATSLEREAVFVSSMLLCHKTVSFISIVFVADHSWGLVLGLGLGLGLVLGLIHKFRNRIKSGWIKLRGVKETKNEREDTMTVVYVSNGLPQSAETFTST